ncbi:uncharacterized protein LOC115896366 [Rhinopithecus roxellana]|uniref:uncharacterized protein LOC115896366 n=1 Tax=Rhinopithecus roxellana TaxID=61622 RepID=UPI0012374C05|nr:uncharacterized protein LOC115896366 [Rhinopithecus roxellana]
MLDSRSEASQPCSPSLPTGNIIPTRSVHTRSFPAQLLALTPKSLPLALEGPQCLECRYLAEIGPISRICAAGPSSTASGGGRCGKQGWAQRPACLEAAEAGEGVAKVEVVVRAPGRAGASWTPGPAASPSASAHRRGVGAAEGPRRARAPTAPAVSGRGILRARPSGSTCPRGWSPGTEACRAVRRGAAQMATSEGLLLVSRLSAGLHSRAGNFN